ncbi:MAG: branched-chain amino acid transporter permease [Lachnospiraceae bacterium]|nr:branched-chain amino acid transporter permease [Lachnospiraceae bacterium]
MRPEFMRELLIVAAMIAGTLVTRFLPFLIFPAGKATPRFVDFLGKTLPFATMGLLVVYCLKGVQLLAAPHGAPEFLAVLVIVLLHRWKSNSLLSIGAGTVVYMFLVQTVFQ